MFKNNFENGVISLAVLTMMVRFVEPIWDFMSGLFASSMKGQEVFILLPIFALVYGWVALHAFRFTVSFIRYMIKLMKG